MKVEITEFYGFIKWLVTDGIFFVDPLYLDELDKSLLSEEHEDKLSKH